MKIGDEVFVHGYVDEIRKDVIIIRNNGGYFGTVPSEAFCYEEDRNGYGTLNEADTPQTESTGSPIGDYRDGVGAWQTDKLTEEEFDTMIAKGLLGQTDCDDRYAVRTDSGEVVAYACPLGCEQTDCGWK